MNVVKFDDLCKYISMLEFKRGHSYLIFVDPRVIDFEALRNLKLLGVDVWFVAAIPLNGKSLEDSHILEKKHMYEIQDWLMKAFERADHEEKD